MAILSSFLAWLRSLSVVPISQDVPRDVLLVIVVALIFELPGDAQPGLLAFKKPSITACAAVEVPISASQYRTGAVANWPSPHCTERL